MSGPRVISAAHHDFVEAVEYLFEKDVDLAEDFITRVEDAYRKIGENPERYARLETNMTDRDIRRFQLQRFPYLVIYELFAGEPVVLAIMHASRQPDAWRRRS